MLASAARLCVSLSLSFSRVASPCSRRAADFILRLKSGSPKSPRALPSVPPTRSTPRPLNFGFHEDAKVRERSRLLLKRDFDSLSPRDPLFIKQRARARSARRRGMKSAGGIFGENFRTRRAINSAPLDVCFISKRRGVHASVIVLIRLRHELGRYVDSTRGSLSRLWKVIRYSATFRTQRGYGPFFSLSPSPPEHDARQSFRLPLPLPLFS